MNQRKQDKKAMNYVQSIFYPDVEKLVSDFTLPVQKFMQQMIYGIIRSRSVIAQQTALALDEAISLKKTCDRIYTNLKRPFLYSKLMLSHMNKVAQKITDETPIIMDMSDIYKPNATKMAGLDKVWDGSEHKSNPGYYTFQASLCDPANPKSMTLYYSDLFSLEEEVVFENEKILEFIHQSTILTGNKGIFVGDRGMDRENLLTDMIENDNSFIIRGDERHLQFKGIMMSYRDIAEQMDLSYEVISKNRTFKTNIVEVGYKLPNPPERKHQRKRIAKLYLVVAREEGKGFVYYLCRFRKPYSLEKMLHMAVQYYGMRWSIEEIHRQIKQSFGWEKIQLLNYTSLKNMNALLWIAASFIYNEVSKIALYLVKNIRNKMIYRNFNKEIKKNLSYRLTYIVSYLFGLFRIKPRKRYKGKAKKYFLIKQQLVLCLND